MIEVNNEQLPHLSLPNIPKNYSDISQHTSIYARFIDAWLADIYALQTTQKHIPATHIKHGQVNFSLKHYHNQLNLLKLKNEHSPTSIASKILF
ncbi:hypothetical protein [Methylomonas albis]|uniref:Uncharacterized protein n=1 Tax=Methylomonas albis TaxID=1854563 RepID=A0ABR9D3Q4_9GAMM|nr:hypothetical protein [Methylomonas albis]MBD9357755.1 hypothetical protein [Methylomonas albis]